MNELIIALSDGMLTTIPVAELAASPPVFRNVKDFGAVGDNATDDTLAIQAALNDASSEATSTANGALVYVPPGSYIISASLWIAHGVRLLGENRRASVIKAATTFPASTPLIQLGSGGLIFDCRIEHLTIHARNIAGSICVKATKANQGSGIRDCLLTNFRDTGALFSEGTSLCELERCEIYGSDGFHAGIKATGAGGGFIVQDTTVNADSGGGSYGIYVAAGSGVQLLAKTFAAEHVTDAIFLEGGGTACVLGAGIGPSVTNIVRVGSANGAAKILLSLRGAGAGRVALLDQQKGVSSGTSTSVEFAVFSDGTWITSSKNIPFKFPQPAIYMTGLPTTNPGGSGRLWNNAGVVSIT